jgi:hypothetical protein
MNRWPVVYWLVLLALVLLSGCVNIVQSSDDPSLPTLAATAGAPATTPGEGSTEELPGQTPPPEEAQTWGPVDFFQGGVITLSGPDQPLYLPFTSVLLYPNGGAFCQAWGVGASENGVPASLLLAWFPATSLDATDPPVSGTLYYPADAAEGNNAITQVNAWGESFVVISPALPGAAGQPAGPSLRQIEGQTATIAPPLQTFTGALELGASLNSLSDKLSGASAPTATPACAGGIFGQVDNAVLVIRDNRQNARNTVLVVLSPDVSGPSPPDQVNVCRSCRTLWCLIINRCLRQ